MLCHIKRILNWSCVIVIAPLAFLCWVEKCFTRGGETFFQLCTHFIALLPGLPGVFLRRAFYYQTLEKCSMNCHIGFGTFFSHRESIVEDHVYIGPMSIIGTAKIGKGSFLGSRVSLLSGKEQHVKDEDGKWTPADYSRFIRINIASNVWVGEGAIIMANVESGTLVAAGAIVPHNIKTNVVVAGNPARFVKKV